MSLQSQLYKIKENWLLVLIIIVLLGAMNFFPTKIVTNQGFVTESISRDAAFGMPGVSSFSPGVEERVITKFSQLTVKSSLNKDSQVKSLIETNNALILNENKRKYSITYSIRVPTENYQSLLESFKNLGKVDFFVENKDDVTDQNLNLQTQLTLEKQRLANYKQILTEAETAQEKLEVSDRIFNLERVIKSYEESIKNLNERVSFSTIQLTLQDQEYEFISFKDMLKSLTESINALIKVLIMVIPWIIVGYIIYRLKKKF